MKTKLLIIIFYPVLCFAQLEVMCFDVGQGNCTLILHRDYTQKIPPLLVDCGSKSYEKFRGKTFKNDQIKKISDTILDYVQNINKYGIIIVASHADEDHYNWIAAVIQKCILANNEIYVQKLFLGGSRNLYDYADFKSFLDNLVPEPGTNHPIILPALDSSTIIRTPIFTVGAISYYLILPALKTPKKNDSSLVVLINDPSLKMIIMGDATGKTTQHIADNSAALEEGLIFHASHHGADSYGSNNADWLKLLKPRGAILSSGVNTGLRHPRGVIVKRLVETLATEGEFYYPLYFGLDAEELRCYAKGSLKYGLTAVRQFIRSTLTQGTVSYSFDPASAQVTAVSEIPEASVNAKVCILKTLLKFPRGLLEEDHLEYINISNLGITDEEGEDSDRDLLHKFLSSLVSKAAFLKTLYMQKNTIKSEVSINKIVELLKKRASIASLDLSNNGIVPARHKEIKTSLGEFASKIIL